MSRSYFHMVQHLLTECVTPSVWRAPPGLSDQRVRCSGLEAWMKTPIPWLLAASLCKFPDLSSFSFLLCKTPCWKINNIMPAGCLTQSRQSINISIDSPSECTAVAFLILLWVFLHWMAVGAPGWFGGYFLPSLGLPSEDAAHGRGSSLGQYCCRGVCCHCQQWGGDEDFTASGLGVQRTGDLQVPLIGLL